MSKLKEPKHFKVLRILAFSLLSAGILLIVLGCAVFRVEAFVGDGTDANFALLMPGIFLCFFSAPCFFMGFMPKINKMNIETTKYLQQSNKNNLTDILNSKTRIGLLSDCMSCNFKENSPCDYCMNQGGRYTRDGGGIDYE